MIYDINKEAIADPVELCSTTANHRELDNPPSVFTPLNCYQHSLSPASGDRSTMIQAHPHPHLTPDDYLESEKESPIKHEYINGYVYAMAGASDAHVTIGTNLTALLRPHLRGKPCRLYPSDMKVKIASKNCYYYPDLFITCDVRDQESTYFKEYPKIIIEVLSNSTEAFDRGDKFDDYSEIETLQEYVLISQKQQRIDCFRRNKDGVWFLTRYRSSDQFVLETIEFSCDVVDVYEDVVIPIKPVHKIVE